MRLIKSEEALKTTPKLGSLFDGSGGFPLAGSLGGITPVWAAEVEPYPIAVTSSRFPDMKHLGDISKVNGAEIEPVDIITFGSPCQDLSVAGKRAGLKHEANGDEETTRSGLFMEEVRIIKEMRRATNGLYPTFAVWENVPGAFSSNRGEDFRTVLEELIKIVEPRAVMPAVPQRGWAYADSYSGDGWSLAYRTFDAQYWGVPQRRRRIYLVLDLRGERAHKVLFEREGLRGYFEAGRSPWQATAGNAENRTATADSAGDGVAYGWPLGFRPENVRVYEETATTICNGTRPGFTTGVIQPVGDKEQHLFENHAQDARYKGPLDVCPMLPAQLGTGGNNTPLVCEENPVYCLQGNGIDRADTAGCNGAGWREGASYTIDRPAVAYGIETFHCHAEEETVPTLKARGWKDPNVVCHPIVFDKDVYNSGVNATGGHYIAAGGPAPSLRTEHPPGVCVRCIVRRLTPTECARFQGFPDNWGHVTPKEDFTDEEYSFWLDDRNTHAAINGKTTKEYTKQQMLTWYNKLHTDSAEYKMWGNGIALPTALYCMQGISEVLHKEDENETD